VGRTGVLSGAKGDFIDGDVNLEAASRVRNRPYRHLRARPDHAVVAPPSAHEILDHGPYRSLASPPPCSRGEEGR